MSFQLRSALILAALLYALAGFAQQPVPDKPTQTLDNEFVQMQFGAEFTLAPQFPVLVADFDRDNVEDVAIVARAKNPLVDEGEHGYRVLDPYDDFFGVGDPKITSQFGAEDPERRGLVLLIVHGAGPQAWRSSTPKAKFVIINLPFRQVAVKHIQIRKKRVFAIYAEEAGGDQMTSVIFFDGKKYKYQPMGASLQ
ncbi:MAG TPA: hypothetical protein VGF08_09950 [Terriglobales bacterium]|jgi:hypothetical protein